MPGLHMDIFTKMQFELRVDRFSCCAALRVKMDKGFPLLKNKKQSHF
jgi:hypothetical protein